MAKKTTDDRIVLGMLAHISQGSSVKATADLFKKSPSSLNDIVRGIRHTEISGLEKGTERSGVDYIRANKEKFTELLTTKTETKKPATESVKPTSKKPTKATKKPASVKHTTKPTKPTKTNTHTTIGSFDVAGAESSIRNSAMAVVNDIDARMDSLKVERERWVKLSVLGA